jgi:hypothetical protein
MALEQIDTTLYYPPLRTRLDLHYESIYSVDTVDTSTYAQGHLDFACRIDRYLVQWVVRGLSGRPRCVASKEWNLPTKVEHKSCGSFVVTFYKQKRFIYYTNMAETYNQY